ncbi:C40 family peptidase [Corynebacterium sp. Q4381]|uniref:C40 family peptidase n=1 Tax=Corynebacterium sp. Marseille-Q4381 TaxID=3121597 RepID=UPI002FE635A5
MFSALGSHILDPVSVGLKILAHKPDLIPTMPRYRTPGFDDFAPLAAVVGADPARHMAMVQGLRDYRGEISDAVAAASLLVASTASKMTAIAIDTMDKGSRALALGSVLGPVGAGIAAAVVMQDGVQKACNELEALHRELGVLKDKLELATAALLAVAVPGGSAGASAASETLRGFVGSAPAPAVTPSAAAPPKVSPSAVPSRTQPASVEVVHAPPTVDPMGQSGSSAGPTPAAQAAVAAAKSQIGTPYVWGGAAPGGFDCSGLTSWAYRQAGVEIPRTAAAQTVGRQVSYNELLPGDLVLWTGHAAMYVGDGMMVEAGSPVQMNPVRTSNMGMGFQGFWRPTG